MNILFFLVENEPILQSMNVLNRKSGSNMKEKNIDLTEGVDEPHQFKIDFVLKFALKKKIVSKNLPTFFPFNKPHSIYCHTFAEIKKKEEKQNGHTQKNANSIENVPSMNG